MSNEKDIRAIPILIELVVSQAAVTGRDKFTVQRIAGNYKVSTPTRPDVRVGDTLTTEELETFVQDDRITVTTIA